MIILKFKYPKKSFNATAKWGSKGWNVKTSGECEHLVWNTWNSTLLCIARNCSSLASRLCLLFLKYLNIEDSKLIYSFINNIFGYI